MNEELARLRELPGGKQVLELARARDDVELVGGAVRDLLLHGAPREIDLVLGGDPSCFETAARMFADDLVELLMRDGLARTAPQVTLHRRFRTAIVHFEGGRVDIATRRAESYVAPGALPEVRAGDYGEDLSRRDFSVNAIALGLGKREGELRSVDGALEDLRAGRLRVLHPQSFVDDPTRLLRLARYAARLQFSVEQETESLAKDAIAEDALETVSFARIGAELRLATEESDPIATFTELSRRGLIGAVDPFFTFDERLQRDAASLLPSDGREDLLALAALMAPFGIDSREPGSKAPGIHKRMRVYKRERMRKYWKDLLDCFGYAAREREVVVEAAIDAPELAEAMRAPLAPSALHELLSRRHPETVALAGAIRVEDRLSVAEDSARLWLGGLRRIRLQITGADLVAAGCPQGPEIGARLQATLRRRLDGEIEDDKEAQLRFAIADFDDEAARDRAVEKRAERAEGDKASKTDRGADGDAELLDSRDHRDGGVA